MCRGASRIVQRMSDSRHILRQLMQLCAVQFDQLLKEWDDRDPNDETAEKHLLKRARMVTDNYIRVARAWQEIHPAEASEDDFDRVPDAPEESTTLRRECGASG